MKNIVRLDNLYLLAYEYSSQASLAEKLNMEHKDLVRYFTNKHCSISDEFARQIERAVKKPSGWMDRENLRLNLNNDEWRLVQAYREGSDRDKFFLTGLANLIL